MAAHIDGVSGAARQRTSFYFATSVVFALVAFGGFARTYLVPVATNGFDGPSILHLHGLLFFAWTILLVAQSRLVERRRIDSHRAWGLVGISLATAMVFTGVALVVRGLESGIAAGTGATTRVLAIVPLSQVLLFGALFAAAVAYARRPEAHKRLMLLATANLLPPAIARLIGAVVAPDVRPSFAAAVPDVNLALTAAFAAALVVDVLVVVGIVRDWRTRGRPHPAYLIGGAAMLLVHALRGPFAGTALWHSIAEVLASLAA
jgi:hypothetical protein